MELVDVLVPAVKREAALTAPLGKTCGRDFPMSMRRRTMLADVDMDQCVQVGSGHHEDLHNRVRGVSAW